MIEIGLADHQDEDTEHNDREEYTKQKDKEEDKEDEYERGFYGGKRRWEKGGERGPMSSDTLFPLLLFSNIRVFGMMGSQQQSLLLSECYYLHSAEVQRRLLRLTDLKKIYMYVHQLVALSVCVRVFLYLQSLNFSLCVSLFLFLTPSLPHSVFLCVCAYISLSVSVSLCVAVSLSPSSLYHSSVRFFLHHAILCFYVSSFFIRSCVSLLYCVLYNHDHNFLDPKINTGTRVKTEAKIRINNG